MDSKKGAWMPDGKDRIYQICVKCVMDTSDPDISFDANGVCSHCTGFTTRIRPYWKPNAEGAAELAAQIERIKAEGKGQEYDCILGVSGGVDSSFLAAKAVEWGLRPLAVHVDAGWNSELAVKNIDLLVSKLKIDLVTHIVDWEDMKELQLAFLRSHVANQDIPQDHAFFAALYSYATKSKIKYVLNGTNYATESILPQGWGYDAMDAVQLRAIHKQFGTRPLVAYPIISFFDYFIRFPRLIGMQVVDPLNLMPYDKSEAIAYLEREFGWRYYGGKHYESRWTRFFQGHYLPRKFGYDKRRAHLASLILADQLTRDEALAELKKPLYTNNELADDKAFVAKKLGISLAELESLIDMPPRHYSEFPTHERMFRTMFTALKVYHAVRGRLGRVVRAMRTPSGAAGKR
jgi:N-acetyl sugar amidotransferase